LESNVNNILYDASITRQVNSGPQSLQSRYLMDALF